MRHRFRATTTGSACRSRRLRRAARYRRDAVRRLGVFARARYESEPEPSHGYPHRLRLTLPPLAAVWLFPPADGGRLRTRGRRSAAARRGLLRRAASISRSTRRTPSASSCVSSTRAVCARSRACRCRSAPAISGTASCPHHSGVAGTAVRLSRARTVRSRGGPSLQSREAVDRPVCACAAGRLRWHPAIKGRCRAQDPQPDGADSAPFVPKSRVTDTSFDWGRVRSPHVPWRDTIVYELHVKGYTQRHPGCQPELRGKYLGLAHPAVTDHLKRLGITTVELMPCQAFVSEQPLLERGLVNYWGYNPIAWFAPDARYAIDDPRRRVQDHGAGSARCGTRSRARRRLQPHRRGRSSRSDAELARVRQRELLPARGARSQRVQQLHGLRQHASASTMPRCAAWCSTACGTGSARCVSTVSGSTWPPSLGRDRSGYSGQAPFFASLRSDPVLAHVKFIAEPWDVGPGGYQLGHFPAGWSEWNDRYRDAVRAYWRGDAPLLRHVRRTLRRVERPVPSPRPQTHRQPQFHRRPTMVSRCTIRSRTTIGTTKPISRTAWTATRTT